MVDQAQFDVCVLVGLREGSAVDLAVILQDDGLAIASTRIVAPLIPANTERTVERVTPVVEVERMKYLVGTHLLTTVPRRNLGRAIASLKAYEREIKNALDVVLFGV